MNLCQLGSGIMNNESLRKAQQNRYELIAFDPGIEGYGVSVSLNFSVFFFRGSMPLDPPIIIIRAFEADSPLVSPVTLVLNVQ